MLEPLSRQTHLTASAVQRHLEAWQQARDRGREADTDTAPSTENRMPASAVQAYARVGRSTGQKVTHESA
ncbi:hypothetical protein [Marinimicrobium sp. ABcell2]|uniref:hypothetical protein n=1 Tax=Marinimicrobium sp. ABcell2 TaxID=3069751 RepID=UPI0027B217BF|nr:hypothetical protein [Marinimicrobium sp. ABcell2]MDQ2077473.1 hypothetical protein [Marinimicrobium sp. ABcell2]